MATTIKDIIHEIRPDENNTAQAVLVVKRVGLLADLHREKIEIISYIDKDNDVLKAVELWRHLIEHRQYSNFIAHYDATGNLPYIVGYRPKIDANGMFVRNQGQIMYERVPIHDWIWENINGKIPEGMSLDHLNLWRHDNRLSNLRPVTMEEQRANKRNPSVEPPHDINGITYFDKRITKAEHEEKLYYGASFVDNIFMGRFEQGEEYEAGVRIHQVTQLLFQHWSKQEIYNHFKLLKTGASEDKVESAIQSAITILNWKEPDFL